MQRQQAGEPYAAEASRLKGRAGRKSRPGTVARTISFSVQPRWTQLRAVSPGLRSRSARTRRGAAGQVAGSSVHSLLNGWAGNRAIGTEHAAIALLRPEQCAASLALVEELAGVGRHRLGRRVSAMRAGNQGLKLHSIHARF